MRLGVGVGVIVEVIVGVGVTDGVELGVGVTVADGVLLGIGGINSIFGFHIIIMKS